MPLSPVPWYPASYDPCAQYYAEPHAWLAPSCYGAAVSYVPVVCAPMPIPCASQQSMLVPHELAVTAATSPQEVWIGGTSEVHPTLEYLVEPGAPAPEVKVTITSEGATTTWTETAISEGYHVKDDFMAIKPGAKVTIKVTDLAARLRWCETLRCC